MILFDYLKEKLFGPRKMVQCPYCANPDRNSVFDKFKGCVYDNTQDIANGIIGADPPCISDEYPTDYQLSLLGCAR